MILCSDGCGAAAAPVKGLFHVLLKTRASRVWTANVDACVLDSESTFENQLTLTHSIFILTIF